MELDRHALVERIHPAGFTVSAMIDHRHTMFNVEL